MNYGHKLIKALVELRGRTEDGHCAPLKVSWTPPEAGRPVLQIKSESPSEQLSESPAALIDSEIGSELQILMLTSAPSGSAPALHYSQLSPANYSLTLYLPNRNLTP